MAILCGDSGEKIELFAGTYRTALSLSRTFILPDSPRSLELQLQGDDLVELFLVFAQNVFGLEPATVRVREVRIGRAERRAARRRAREARGLANAEASEGNQAIEDTPQTETVITSIVTVGDSDVPDEPRPRTSQSGSRTRVSSEGATNGLLSPQANGDAGGRDGAGTPSSIPGVAVAVSTSPEDAAALAAVSAFGPYTTFQQLSYAPAFPLGTIADDYIIPPTYPEFVDYREAHEPDAIPIADLLTASSSATTPTPAVAPSLPALPPPPPPPPAAPLMWYYIDPKGVTQGPWKTSLMQSWFNDGFLPPELPVRRDTETDYTPLKDLCDSAIDPNRPFQPPVISLPVTPTPAPIPTPTITQTLLKPISLLVQPRRFGPPALFYTSRGGHSTTIVDSRGKSVLRGRLNWTVDDEALKLGDIKRLEAFDTRDRAVIVALRQGGVEALDVGDALCQPGDESRGLLPNFQTDPAGISRRPAFSWKLGGGVGISGLPPIESPHSSIHISKRSTIPAKKSSTAPSTHQGHRAAAKSDSNAIDDADGGPLEEEILFLGRHHDQMYFCERNLGSFRILSLGTIT